MALLKGGGSVSPDKIQDDSKDNKIVINSASNQIEITTNGVENVRVTSAGVLEAEALEVKDAGYNQVLIGSTDGLGAALYLDGNANGDGIGGDGAYIIHSGDDSTLRIVNEANSPLELRTNNTLAVTVAANGEPTFEQRMYAANGNTANPAYSFANSTGMGAYLFTANHYAISTAGSLRFSIDPSGNIGNTSSPDSNLDITHASGTYGTAGVISQRTDSLDGIFYGLYNATQKWDLASIMSSGPYLGIRNTTSGQTPLRIITNASTDTLKLENDQIQGLTGSAGSPTFSFGVDADTGMYRPAINQVAVACGGLDVVTYSSGGLAVASSGQVKTGNGSAGVPSYTATADLNTGLFFPAADEFAITTAGVEAIRVDENQNVGIGTNNPLTPLHIDSGGAATTGIRLDVGATYDAIVGYGNGGKKYFQIGEVGTNDPGRFSLYDNEIEKVRLDAAGASYFTGGNVGIGLSSLTTKFQVNNNSNNVARIKQEAVSLSNSVYTFEIDSSSHTSNLTAAGAFKVSTSADDSSLIVSGNGRVGMGLASPDEKLHLLGNIKLDNRGNGSFSNSSISLLSGDSAGVWNGVTLRYEKNLSVDRLAIVTGGVDHTYFTNSGGIETVGTGSATTPIYSFSTDTNTGFYNRAADQIGITTGGVERAFISSASATFINPASSSLIVLRRSQNDITDGAVVGQIQFEGNNDLNSLHRYATIQVEATDVSDGTEDTSVVVAGIVAGSLDQDLLNIGEKGLKVRSGSAALPAYSYLTDSDTGMYRITTDTLGFSVGGTLALRISGATDAVGILDGLVTAPSLTFINDSDTGIFSSGSNEFAITTGGTLALKADGNQSIIAGGGSLATTATDGFLYIPTCAGTPTGVPTTKTGFIPLVIDSTNNKLYFYSGGSWRDAGP